MHDSGLMVRRGAETAVLVLLTVALLGTLVPAILLLDTAWQANAAPHLASGTVAERQCTESDGRWSSVGRLCVVGSQPVATAGGANAATSPPLGGSTDAAHPEAPPKQR
jgi:hypothetical protein